MTDSSVPPAADAPILPAHIEDTIRAFNAIMDGEVDEYPEAAFNLVGTIEDAIEKGKKLKEQSNG